MIRIRISNENTVNCPNTNGEEALEECKQCDCFACIDKYGTSILCKARIWLMKEKSEQRSI